jgi:hypothetical protein
MVVRNRHGLPLCENFLGVFQKEWLELSGEMPARDACDEAREHNRSAGQLGRSLRRSAGGMVA